VELGATDQKFNVLVAREIQKAYGVEPQSILTLPVLPGIDGIQKMSKSLGNYVGVADPPEEVYGKLMRVPDQVLPVYYSLLLDTPLDPSLAARDAKRAMARELTARLHGEAAADAAEERFDRVHIRRELPEQIDDFSFGANGEEAVHLPALLADAFGISRSEGRRMLAQEGVKLDGEVLDDTALDVPPERLDGAVLQLGRRRFKRLRRR
jgi:tyrosyl-tRNA synthetase